MGVYIDIEMPKGELGAIPIMIYADGDVEHFFSHEKYGKVIEVPEPHGDLIDRDKLRAKEFIQNGDAYAVVMSRDIRNAPAIIPASKEGE